METVEITEQVEEPIDVSEPQYTQYIGEFTITYYCCEQYPHICNAGEPYLTATGTTPTAGRTIAVDPSVIPYRTEVVIDGQTYIAEDCGGAINGNRIDIVVETHQEALEKGIHTAEVFIKEN